MEYNFSLKRIIYIMRMLVVIVLAYFIFLSPENDVVYSGYAFIAFYLGTCLVVFYIPDDYFHDSRLLCFIVLFDSLMISVGIYLSGMAGTDLYLIYFFIICLAALSSNFAYLMVSVAIFAGIYGWILFDQGFLAGDIAVGYMLRLPFIMVIAMFFGFLASTVANGNKKYIRETEKQYRLLFDSSDIFVFTVNRSGEFLSANPKLYLQHGFADEIEILGRPYTELYDKEESDNFLGYLDTVFETGICVEYESCNRKFDKWFLHALSPIRDPVKGDVFAVGAVSRDITERVKKEVELQRAYDILRDTRDQLIQKDKMASLGRLASGIAHEIRNPMEIILMGIDYLENNFPEDNETARNSIDRIYNAVDRVNRIINDILKFSRKTAFVIEKVNVCELIDDVLVLAGHHLKKCGIEVQKNLPDSKLEVAANRNMLEQVLLNLVNNSVDAMEDAPLKIMTINACRMEVSSVGYKAGYRKTDYFKIGDGMVVIDIVDTGKGMDEDVLTKLFEPFFTTKETGKGTGLGLSIALMIMDRMKGTIDVDSSTGKGSSFFVKLQPAANILNFTKDEIDGLEKSIDY